MAADLDRLLNLIEGRNHAIESLENILAHVKSECRKLDESELLLFRQKYVEVATFDVEIALLNC